MPIKNISGQTFQYLTAIKFVGTRKNQQAWWLFRCKCGVEKELKSSNVVHGKTASCGCIHRKDISGERFGRLIAIESTSRRYKNIGSYIWRCKCDCGKETEVPIAQLNYGQTKSCGCYAKEMFRIVNTTHGLSKTKEYRRFKAHKYREKYFGVDTTWTPLMEIALSELFTECVVCGSRDHLETDHVFPKSKRYNLRPGNAIKLCRSHNRMKNNKMPNELSKEMLNRILPAARSFKLYWSLYQDKYV